MKFIKDLLFQFSLLGFAAYIVIIFTTQYDYQVRNSSADYSPKLYRKGQYLTFSKVPLETPYSIDNIELSIVIPAYNEEQRLPIMIEQTINYFTQKNLKFEIIIVNDGSSDNTWGVILDLASKKYPANEISGITYKKNAGKGYAVTIGMKYTRGKYILMADGDGATDIGDFEKLYNVVNNKTEEHGIIAIGSRNHLVERVVKQRAWHRNILMYINNFFVKTLIGINNIKDTQCGFKLFSRRAVYNIFPNLHLVRWAFDVEILYLAKNLNIPVTELPVNWKEIEGSKLNVVAASISFFRDYFAILTYYNTGFWKISLPN